MRMILIGLPPMPIGALTLAALADRLGISLEVLEFPSRGGEQELIVQLAEAAVVGFSTVCTKYPRTLLLAKRLKALSPDTLIVFGGPQATITAHETLRCFPYVDLIIRGEAEEAWPFFLDQVSSGRRNWKVVPGAVWQEGNRIVETPPARLCDDLDILPIPKYSAYPKIAQFPFAMIEVGRGCPYTCTFCCTNTFFSRQSRMKSPGRILSEMEYLHTLYGLDQFDFVHDMFTFRPDIVRQVCLMLKNRPYTWGCSSRTDALTPEMLDLMGEAGCRGFYFGIETGSPRMQKLLKKNLNVTEAVQVIDMVRKRGFRTTVSIIFGFPQETCADLRDSLLLVTELMARRVDNLQLPVWGPLADTPLTHSWEAYAFDQGLSNFADTDGTLSPDEEALIRGNFQLFSTFYYPQGTAYSHDDYLVLTTFLEDLQNYALTRRFIVERDRVAFVNFLTLGGFAVGGAGWTIPQVTERLLGTYAQASPHGQVIARLLEFDKSVRRVAGAPVGWRERVVVGAAESDLVLSDFLSGTGMGTHDSLFLWLIKDADGLRLSV